MSIFFLHPIYLLGLFAASLPILIHLLNRRKLNRVRFPAVRFIMLSQRRVSRSYRLRHWLLLALRTLAVVFLALLLANPIFQTGAGLFAAGGQLSLIVVLDNSLSMTWSGDGHGFKQAKETARLFISSLQAGDRAVVIPTYFGANETFRLKGEKEVLLREVDQLEIGHGTASFSAALAKAYELLNAPAAQKQIVLITDMTLTGWDQFSISALEHYDASVPLKLIRIRQKEQPLNGTIKEIRLGRRGVGIDFPIYLEAVIANFGTVELEDLLVQLSIDGQNRDQKLVSIAPKGEISVTFQTRLNRAGSHAGQVTLKKDGLAGYSTSYFTMEVPDKTRILVVDGDPQTSLAQSETFFLTRALNPTGEHEASAYLPTVIIPEGLNAASLDPYDVVILCNVTALPDGVVAKLQRRVRQGGGLLIFGGDRVQAKNYNTKLAPSLLPVRLGERRLGTETSGEQIAQLDLTHPALEIFADPILEESIKSTRFWGYSRVAAPAQSALITLANGDPLLIEQKTGDGRVLLFTTSADRDWTDLPIKTAYLPLIQALAQYLSGGKRGSLDPGILVGTNKEISLPPTAVGQNLRVVKPNKTPREIPVSVRDTNRVFANFQENDIAGIYRMSLAGAPASAGGSATMYAVNPFYLESRLDEISRDELQLKLRPIRVEVLEAEAVEQGGKRIDLALPLLGLLMITLLLEGWVSLRF